jgi:hypothetical protein
MHSKRFPRSLATIVALAAAWPLAALAEPQPDPTFGNNGVVDVALPGANFYNPAHVEVLPDRRIAVARADSGADSTTGAWTASFARLLPGGGLDPTFGSGGTVTFVLRSTPASFSQIDGRHVRADGSQIVLLHSWPTDGSSAPPAETVLLSVTADGRLDPAFNGGQPLQIAPYLGEKLFVDNSAIIVAGIDSERCCDNTTGFFAQRFLANGTLDTAFGTGGTLDIEATQTHILDAMPIPGGGFQVLHEEATPEGRRNFWRRHRTNGSVDTAFGNGGDRDVPTLDGLGILAVHPLGDGTWLAMQTSSCPRRILDAQGSVIDTFSTTCPYPFPSTQTRFGADVWGSRLLLHGEQRTGFLPLPSDGPYVWALDRDGRFDALFSQPQDAYRWRLPGTASKSYDVAVDGTDRFVAVSAEFAADSVRVTRFVERRGGGASQPIPALGVPGVLLLLGGAAVLARRRLTSVR